MSSVVDVCVVDVVQSDSSRLQCCMGGVKQCYNCSLRHGAMWGPGIKVYLFFKQLMK